MAIHRFQTADGKIHRVEAPTRSEAEAELNRALGIKPNVGADVAKSFGSGLMEGVSSVGDQAYQATPAGMARGMIKAAPKVWERAKKGDFLGAVSEAVSNPSTPYADKTNPFRYTPQTVPGEYAHTGGQMAPNLFAPGGPVRKVANWAVPAIASETFGQVARASGADETGQDFARLGGAVVGGGLSSIRAPRNPFKPQPLPEGSHGRVLADIGVSSTPFERGGPGLKIIEDGFKRSPLVGSTAAGYQDRRLGQLNRGVGLMALREIGEGIPSDVKPGFQMVQYVDKRLGDAYDRAADMVPVVRPDARLTADIQGISAREANLSESEMALWQKSLKDKLTRLDRPDGVDSKTFKEIVSEVGDLQAEHARKGNSTLAKMFGDLKASLRSTVGRANPEAAALIAKADKGWQVYSVMNDAAGAAASKRGGVFLPGQLGVANNQAAARLGSNMKGKGMGPLQDVVTAANAIMPDSYGNPGTANALGLMGAAGGVGAAVFNPALAPVALTGAAASAAAATPYLLAGRKVMESLPPRPTAQQLELARRQLELLAQRDPAVTPLLEFLRRAGPVAGMSAMTAARPTDGQ